MSQEYFLKEGELTINGVKEPQYFIYRTRKNKEPALVTGLGPLATVTRKEAENSLKRLIKEVRKDEKVERARKSCATSKRILDVGPQAFPIPNATDAIDLVDLRRDWKKEGGVSPTKIRFCRGNVEAMPYKTGTFQKVFAGGVVGAYSDIPKSLSEISRVLVRGGVAELRTWGRYVPQIRKLAPQFGLKWINSESGGNAESYQDDDVFINLQKT